MIAVSSMKPIGIAAEIDRNQRAAYASWQRVFSFITYFNNPQPDFNGENTSWWATEQWPRIKELAEYCAKQDEWCAIVNADIVIGPQFAAVERRLLSNGAKCATSRRYEFDPATGVGNGTKVADNGMDIFCAAPDIWWKMAHVIPDQFRIGHNFWDTWTLGFFQTVAPAEHYDFTPSRCVFHPQHGNRCQVHPIDTTKWDKYARAANWPDKKIAV